MAEQPPTTIQDTRERILDTAERLFAEQGLTRTSLRQITTEAEVNLAAVHYHFGSKTGLVHAVHERHIGPVNEERLRLLDRYEADPAGGGLERIVEAFVGPVLRMHATDPERGRCVRCLIGRLYTEPDESVGPLLEHFDEVRQRFPAAFSRELPELSETDLMWRLHFLLGALLHTAGAGDLLTRMTGGRCDPGDVDAAVAQLVGFISAGLRAQPVAA